MSGHSKWHNIKLKKGKVDAQRGALFTKLSKEIILAAKGGSPDPEANYRLKMAVEKAREFNMPHENIKRAIARSAGQGGEREIEEIRYEGYGPHGMAVVVDAATDNRNRTAGELRFLFSRHDGSLGESGGVAWMFDPVGIRRSQPGRKIGRSADGAGAYRRRRRHRIRRRACRHLHATRTSGRRARRAARPGRQNLGRLSRNAREE